jgi:hypothetical protein
MDTILNPTAERNALIHKARIAGRTLQSVADEFSINRERVRQICFKADRMAAQRRDDAGTNWYELSTRTRNALLNYYFPHLPREAPIKASAVASAIGPSWRLSRIPNFGRKSQRELMEWLVANGEKIPEPTPPTAKPRPKCPHCGEHI